jgi:hypothetical protein
MALLWSLAERSHSSRHAPGAPSPRFVVTFLLLHRVLRCDGCHRASIGFAVAGGGGGGTGTSGHAIK